MLLRPTRVGSHPPFARSAVHPASAVLSAAAPRHAVVAALAAFTFADCRSRIAAAALAYVHAAYGYALQASQVVL